jgi:hypothetical protein
MLFSLGQNFQEGRPNIKQSCLRLQDGQLEGAERPLISDTVILLIKFAAFKNLEVHKDHHVPLHSAS